MSERSVILEKLQKKEAEIQSLEEKLRTARIYVQALNDVLNVFPRAPADQTIDSVLRPGSSVALVREVIIRARKPVHISDLLGALGKGVTKEGRASLASSLAAYVRRGEIFTRPAPNTFGLVELGHTPDAIPAVAEPPAGFGQLQTIADDDEIPF